MEDAPASGPEPTGIGCLQESIPLLVGTSSSSYLQVGICLNFSPLSYVVADLEEEMIFNKLLLDLLGHAGQRKVHATMVSIHGLKDRV